MKLKNSPETKRWRLQASRAFTLVEVMVASGVVLLLVGAALSFADLSGKSISGSLSQSTVNGKAGCAIELIQLRARFATKVAVDSSGKILTLYFDDNYGVDSNGDGITYNDTDHAEEFRFQNGDGNDETLADNSLVYKPRSNGTTTQVLISGGLRKLPGQNVFTITNVATVRVNFGLALSTSGGRFQSIDIQGTALPLNRSESTNIISILP